MRKLSLAVVLVAGAAAAADLTPPPLPNAAPTEGQAWTVVGARTAGANKNVLEAGLGWPGVYASFSHGFLPNLDLGARAAFTYGVEGMVRSVYPGLKVQGLIRFRFVDTGRISLSAVFEPGPFFWFAYGGVTYTGFAIPIGVRLGIAAASALTIGITFDVPMWVQFGPGGGLNVPFLTGLGVEYFVRSDLALFAKTRMGPMLRPYYAAEFTFEASLGVGWHF